MTCKLNLLFFFIFIGVLGLNYSEGINSTETDKLPDKINHNKKVLKSSIVATGVKSDSLVYKMQYKDEESQKNKMN